ncbi:hypothetical protein K474DRAFT_758846 [Panus rudis PR-1116 ss-1]|nr:hypothetical protein K474DRAFT_758846 [Panus rudis PR-1116 ss-1]
MTYILARLAWHGLSGLLYAGMSLSICSEVEDDKKFERSTEFLRRVFIMQVYVSCYAIDTVHRQKNTTELLPMATRNFEQVDRELEPGN